MELVNIAVLTVAFTAMFSAVFSIARVRWALHLREHRHEAPKMAAYTAAGSHGVGCIVVGGYLLASCAWHDFEGPNQESHNVAMDLSLGYFIAVSAEPYMHEPSGAAAARR